jgi:predicted nucleotidyltransferase
MRPSEVLEKNRQAIREATKRFNAANPRVFGSVARGEGRPDSDLDILGVKVDLVTAGGLPERIKHRVLSEASAI